jgi:hypothetical protein
MNGRRDLILAVSASLIVGCAIGLISGVLFSRMVFFGPHGRPPFGRSPFGRPTFERPPFARHGGPIGMPLQGIAHELELSKTQEARVDSILRESRVRLDSLRSDTREALLHELTPAQRERWERMERQMMGRERRRGGKGPPPDGP